MRRYISLLTLLLLMVSWQSEHRLTKDRNWKFLQAMLRSANRHDNQTIRHDGVYCWIDAEMSKKDPDIQYLLPLTFFDDGLMLADMTAYKSPQSLSALFAAIQARPFRDYEEFGTYQMTGDTIDCYFFTPFAGTGMRMTPFIVHYIGVIKGRDTITGWHMIPPYPKARADLNDMRYFKTPRTYVFKPFPDCRIETDKIWLNKYR